MTSASELFYQRRSRIGRVTAAESEFDPSSSNRHFHSGFHRRHHHSHSRNVFDGCDPLRRSPNIRSPCHRLSSISERGSFRVDQASSQSSINSEGSSSSSSRARLTGNDRLPGAVLLARARLVERLRGVSASANRRSSRVSFDISNRDHTSSDDDLQVVDLVNRGARSVWSSRRTPFSGSTNQTETLPIIPESHKAKPPGLTSEDIESLQLEIFSSFEEKGNSARLYRDCSICLESFEEGDKLVNLPCEHRFHAACLDRWIRACGDCPYCRSDIVVSSCI